ncbi:MAG: acyl-CoA reductase [Verrucomicrobiota bacterium]
MNLPNYFIADLPPGASLTAAMVSEACQTLKRNREKYVAHRSTREMADILCGVAESWLDAASPFRNLALELGPAATRFSRATLEAGIDSFFRRWTPENVNALLTQELGHSKRLDEVASDPAEQRQGRGSIATGPELAVHIAAGNLPDPAWMSLATGLLTRSAQFVKCASGTSLLPRLFAHSIYDAEPKLGACLEIAEWRGGQETGLEQALFDEADLVTATGSDETLAAVRRVLPTRVRFLGYGHKVSFGYAAAGSLSGFQAKKTVAHAAADVAAWDQQGCLSPHVIYVEHGGSVTAELFAEMLAAELDRREALQPRGTLSPEEAAAIASRRSFYEVRAAHSPDTRSWQSPGSTAWTVVYEADARFQASCLNRFIYVKGVVDLDEALRGADAIRGKVSTVGLAAPAEQREEMARRLARWGATRVCPLGRMQQPPLTWRHDGRPALGDLVIWTDVENE